MNILKWIIRISIGLGLSALVLLIILWFVFNSVRQDITDELPGDSKVIETTKGTIEYKIQGHSEKYCLLLHGTPGSYRTFNIKPLLDNGYSVLSLSRPGYFRTPINVGRTLKEQTGAYAALLDTLHIDSLNVIGFSSGASSAIAFAINYPRKCKQLIIMAGIAEQIKPSQAPFIQKMFLSSAFGTWLLIKLMLTQIDNDELRKEAKAYTEANMLLFSEIADGKQNDIHMIENYPDLALEKITAPTLIIHGTEDHIPFSQAGIFRRRIPASQLLKMEGKNHFDVVFFGFDESLRHAIDFIEKNER